MTVVDAQVNGAASEVSVSRVVDPRILEPIPGLKPCGDDIRALKLWVELRAARPKPEEHDSNHDWQPAHTVKTDWSTYHKMVEQALCSKTKDIELGLFLTEACARLHGFVGVRDGMWALSGLITVFKDKGLYPEADNGDFEIQSAKLEWVNEKLPEIVREIPLTRRDAPARNYSLNYRDESRRQNGMITVAEFESAATGGSAEQYRELIEEIEAASLEVDGLKKVTNDHYGSSAPSFSEILETLNECKAAVESMLARKAPQGPGYIDNNIVPTFGPVLHTTSQSDPWSECERAAQSGDVDRALATMAALAAAEPNGRVRFHRRLMLADLCFKTNRKRLATSILEELNEILDVHKLEMWETSEVVGGVWSRLVRSYRDKAAGTADEVKEHEFYLKLSRLDPWQALACGEPAKKE